MLKYSTQILTIGLAFILCAAGVTGWFYSRESKKLELQIPNSAWEPIFFRSINETTELSGLDKLREVKLNEGDIEVRVWRGFGLADLEGVVLQRTNNHWKAFHLKADHYIEPQQAELKELNPPKSGWEDFWKDLTEQGLLTLRDPSETGCEDRGLDGTGYVVEINQNRIYRTYQMREDGECSGVQQMEEIDDLIGVEFDSGKEQCKAAEWFACANVRRSRRGTK